MTVNCEICENKYQEKILFENEKVIVMLAVTPATSGHIQIFPKNHYTIIEQVPQDELDYLSLVANKLSILLFELLKVHGTNIIIQNGVPAGQTLSHFSINIIPRRTDDGLKLDWDMKQATPESLESIHRIINEGMTLLDPAKSQDGNITFDAPKTTEIIKADGQEQAFEKITPSISNKNGKTNYYLKSLERIP